MIMNFYVSISVPRFAGLSVCFVFFIQIRPIADLCMKILCRWKRKNLHLRCNFTNPKKGRPSIISLKKILVQSRG